MSGRVRCCRTGRSRQNAAVELFAAVIRRGDKPVRASGKELELLALLASAYGPLTRDRIGEALWEHLDPEEWSNNLKVTLSRLRAKLGGRDAIVLVDGGYRLSRDIDVDLRRYEAIVRDRAGAPLDEQARAALTGIVDAYRTGATAVYDRLPGVQGVLARIDDPGERGAGLLVERG